MIANVTKRQLFSSTATEKATTTTTKISPTTSSFPLFPSPTLTTYDEAPKRIAIASFVGVSVALVAIILFLIHLYNKLYPLTDENNNNNRNNNIHNNNNSNNNSGNDKAGRNGNSYVIPSNNISNGIKDVERNTCWNIGSRRYSKEEEPEFFTYDVRLKVRGNWDEKYGDESSQKYSVLRDQLVHSIHVLYKHYADFKGVSVLGFTQVE